MNRLARVAAALIALAAVAGVVLQYREYVAGKNGAALVAATVDYFSFFTIESNLLVATLTGALAFSPNWHGAMLIARPAVAGAACLYIAVSGVVYFVVLRELYDPEGLGLLATNLLHYTVPPAFVAFWLGFVPKGRLDLKSAAVWLIFPSTYAAYSLIRGPFTGWYPYPFIDAATLGYVVVFRTVVLFVIGFAAAAGLIVAIDRVIGRIRRTAGSAQHAVERRN